MTTTYPSRRRTDARYRGVVYGLDVLDHETGQLIRNDYVGQTRQRGRGRENQHRDSQPWADLIVGSPRVLWEGLCTDEELDEIERQFIQEPPPGQARPRLNYKLNEDNPQQIPKWTLEAQRWERDDREGRPRWVRPDQRQRDSLLDWDTPAWPVRPAPRRPWSSRRRHLTGVGVGWAALTVGGWIVLAVQAVLTVEAAALLPLLTLFFTVWVWLGVPVRRRGRRKARTRFRKRMQLNRRRR